MKLISLYRILVHDEVSSGVWRDTNCSEKYPFFARIPKPTILFTAKLVSLTMKKFILERYDKVASGIVTVMVVLFAAIW